MAGTRAMKSALAHGAPQARAWSARALTFAIVLIACVLLGEGARADQRSAMLPRIRMPGAPVPANGAIVLESLDATAPLIDVTSMGGFAVSGSVHEVGALPFGGLIFAWVPEAPLEPGI